MIMGYPMRQGYRNPTPAPDAGLSKAPQVPNSVGSMIGIPLSGVPANDIAKRKLKYWIRFHPYIRAAMTGLDLYNLYRSNADFSDYTNNCNRAASGCEEIAGNHQGITGVPTCIGTGISGITNALLPGGIVLIGSWTGVGLGCLGLKNVQFQKKGWKLNPGGTKKPWKYNPWPDRQPAGDPLDDPFSKPITQPEPQTNPIPWEVSPYVPQPWSDPSPISPPSTRPAPNPRPGTRPQTRPGDPNVGQPPEYRPPPNPGDPVPDPQPRTQPDPPLKKPEPDPDPRVKVPKRPGVKDLRRESKRGLLKLPEPTPVFRVAPPSTAFPARPTRHQKEIKVRMGAAVGLMWAGLNAVTEARDFIREMYKALPKRFKTTPYRRHGVGKFASANAPTVQQMFKDLYKGINNMRQDELADFTNKAIDNVIANQIGDYFFGKAGRAAGQGSREVGRTIGHQAGPAL